MSTDNLHPVAETLVYVEPNPKRRIEELLMNPPICILTADVKSVRWLDDLRREARKIK